MHYNDLTWQHFEDPRHAGRLTGDGVRRGSAGSRSFGTWVQFEVQVSDGTGTGTGTGAGRVRAAAFLAFGCPHVIALADFVAKSALGSPPLAELPETVQALRARFEVPVEKLGRLLILEDAWIAALSAPSSWPGPE